MSDVPLADDAREVGQTDTLHDEVGGVFGFNEAKSHYYAGATYIHLGQGFWWFAAYELVFAVVLAWSYSRLLRAELMSQP